MFDERRGTIRRAMSRTPPLRSLLAAALAGMILLAAALVALPGAASGTRDELKAARQELRETKARIRERAHRLRVQKRELNRLATRIARNEARVHEAGEAIAKLEVRIGRAAVRMYVLQEQLDERNRSAYILGPGAPVLYLLTATSAEDAAARLSLLAEMNRRDALLATKVGRYRERLATDRAEVLRLQRAREIALQQLERDRAELHRRLAASRKLFDKLHEQKQTIVDEISRIRPFAVCPVRS